MNGYLHKQSSPILKPQLLTWHWNAINNKLMVGMKRSLRWTASAVRFISHILSVANPNITSVCKIFFERPLSGIVNNYELNVITDCFVASYDGAGLPLNPYFFLQVGSPMRFKQSQRFGKSDGSGRPSTGPNVGCHVIGSQRRTANKSIMIKNHYMAVMWLSETGFLLLWKA